MQSVRPSVPGPVGIYNAPLPAASNPNLTEINLDLTHWANRDILNNMPAQVFLLGAISKGNPPTVDGFKILHFPFDMEPPNLERHGYKAVRSDAPAHQEEAPPAYGELPAAYGESPPAYDEPHPPGGAPAALFPAGMSPRAAIGGVARVPEGLDDLPPPRARSAALMPIARPPQQLMEPADPIAAAKLALSREHLSLKMNVDSCVKKFVDGDAGDRKARAALDVEMRSLISKIAKVDDQNVRLVAYEKLIKGLMKTPEAHPNDSARLALKIIKECLRPQLDKEEKPAQEPARLQSLFNTLVLYQSAHR
jgi:hypothetical protein